MKADKRKIEWLLQNESQYKIHKNTGVAQPTLSSVLNGKRKIENLTLKVASQLTDYANEILEERNMTVVELTIKEYNSYKNDDYIIADYIFDEKSIDTLAEIVGIDLEENNPEDVMDWWNAHSNEEDIKVSAERFYNNTISREDIKVNYNSKVTATFENTLLVTYLDFSGAEFYDNTEAQEYVK